MTDALIEECVLYYRVWEGERLIRLAFGREDYRERVFKQLTLELNFKRKSSLERRGNEICDKAKIPEEAGQELQSAGGRTSLELRDVPRAVLVML